MLKVRLKALLESGATSMLDARFKSRPPDAAALTPFFDEPLLQNVFVLKFVDVHGVNARFSEDLVQTLVYFPYDVASPLFGGESLVLTRTNFKAFLKQRTGRSEFHEKHLRLDFRKLEVLDRLPALNPFVVRESFRVYGLSVDDAYFALTAEQHGAVRGRLKERMTPIMSAAFGSEDEAAARHAEAFVDRLTSEDAAEAIHPFAKAMQLPPDLEMAALQSWIGISFFEDEILRRRDALGQFIGWMNENARQPGHLGRDQHSHFLATRTQALKSVEDTWAIATKALDAYEEAYAGMVAGRPGPFVAFLREAETLFCRVGAALGLVDQTLFAWRDLTGDGRASKLGYGALMQIFTTVTAILGTGTNKMAAVTARMEPSWQEDLPAPPAA